MARQVLENGVVLPAEYSDDWYDDMTSNLTKLDDVIGSDSEKLSSSDVGAAALSNNYNDLDNLPTIPTVNDATLTIQKNGVDVQTFTANASSNVTANITVPTKTSDLTNDSNFVDTSNAAVASGITSAKVTSYDSHIADTDIHVTTADKTKWNNGVSQSYVFRYSSTALVASSTNSNTLLDNTDNLKVGDKVIDSSGVLFSITAIDTQNSTFTIGTALIDLAQDSDVVHKSGGETVGGQKTWSDNQFFTSTVYHKSTTYEIGNIPTSNMVTNIYFADKNSVYTGFVRNVIYSSGRTATELRAKNLVKNGALDPTGSEITSSFNVEVQPNGTKAIYWDGLIRNDVTPYTTNNSSLGSSTNKWSKINGVEPSSLSLPSGNASDVIDISSYITDLSGNINNYTAPANGWITITMSNCTGIHAYITDLWGDSRVRASAGAIKFLMPVLKNQTATFLVFGGSIDNARFIPCQGNV